MTQLNAEELLKHCKGYSKHTTEELLELLDLYERELNIMHENELKIRTSVSLILTEIYLRGRNMVGS